MKITPRKENYRQWLNGGSIKKFEDMRTVSARQVRSARVEKDVFVQLMIKDIVTPAHCTRMHNILNASYVYTQMWNKQKKIYGKNSIITK